MKILMAIISVLFVTIVYLTIINIGLSKKNENIIKFSDTVYVSDTVFVDTGAISRLYLEEKRAYHYYCTVRESLDDFIRLGEE